MKIIPNTKIRIGTKYVLNDESNYSCNIITIIAERDDDWIVSIGQNGPNTIMSKDILKQRFDEGKRKIIK